MVDLRFEIQASSQCISHLHVAYWFLQFSGEGDGTGTQNQETSPKQGHGSYLGEELGRSWGKRRMAQGQGEEGERKHV